MALHPLCTALWLAGDAVERHGAHAAWVDGGGTMQLWAGMLEPKDDRAVRRLSIHHPRLLDADPDLENDVLCLVKALLILDGWFWRGFPQPRGLATLTATKPELTAHALLPLLAQMDAHMARLGWTGTWTDAFRDRLDDVAGFGAVAAGPTFDPSTFHAV